MTLPVLYKHKFLRRRPSSEVLAKVNKIEYITQDEYEALCRVITIKEHKLLVRLLWETGLRIHEALLLRYTDVYPDGLNIMGKGRKQRMVYTQVPLLGELLRHARANPDIAAMWIFEKIRTRWGANLMLKKYAIKSGLTKRMHPHLFRHSYAINFIKQTGDPWSLQTQGGWSDMEIIKTYMRLAREMPRESVNKMYFPEV